jgi:hypothetical protein
MISRCNDCQHREICRYRESYDEIIRDIVVSVPEPFTLTLSCKYYYSTQTYLSSQYRDYNSCSNCATAALTLDSFPG